MSKLIQNAVYIKEDDVFVKSEHQHDFVSYKFRDGLELCLDGGLEYARRVGDLYKLSDADRYEEYCLTDEDSFGVVAERLLWGTRGKDGKSSLRYRPIKELAYAKDGINHMKAILANCLNISPLHKRVVNYWLETHEQENKE